MDLTIQHIDTACVIVDINGYRILTDPVFDKPGKRYHFGYGSFSRKTGSPARTVNDIGKIDLVLLSHAQHKDNFDDSGKAFAKSVDRILTTNSSAKRLSNAIGLKPFETISINDKRVPGLKITATPCQHHPGWLPKFFSGHVIGFVIEYDGQQNGVLYISGDTVFFKGIKQIADKFEINQAIIHLGGVQFPYLTGLGRYTFDAKQALKAIKLLKPKKVFPVHDSGWTHFKDKKQNAIDIFNKAKLKCEVIWLKPGEVKMV